MIIFWKWAKNKLQRTLLNEKRKEFERYISERIIQNEDASKMFSFIILRSIELFVKLNELLMIRVFFLLLIYFFFFFLFNDILCTSFFRANKIIFLLSKKNVGAIHGPKIVPIQQIGGVTRLVLSNCEPRLLRDTF